MNHQKLYVEFLSNCILVILNKKIFSGMKFHLLVFTFSMWLLENFKFCRRLELYFINSYPLDFQICYLVQALMAKLELEVNQDSSSKDALYFPRPQCTTFPFVWCSAPEGLEMMLGRDSQDPIFCSFCNSKPSLFYSFLRIEPGPLMCQTSTFHH